MTQLNQLRAEDFEPLVGQSLAVECLHGTVDCELTAVSRLPPHALRDQPPFALMLRAPPGRPFDQGMVALAHPVHGRLEVFIVPLGPDAAGLRYEITFN